MRFELFKGKGIESQNYGVNDTHKELSNKFGSHKSPQRLSSSRPSFWMLARLIVVIMSQYIQTLNHYDVHLKLV